MWPIAATRITFFDHLTFRTAYTYAHYTFRGESAFSGNFLPGQPRHLLRAELPYQHPCGFWASPILDWSPAEYFADSANTAPNDAYAVLGLKAGYDWRPLGLFFEANNLANKLYSASVQVDSGNLRFYERANGRSFYGGARWHLFGRIAREGGGRVQGLLVSPMWRWAQAAPANSRPPPPSQRNPPPC